MQPSGAAVAAVRAAVRAVLVREAGGEGAWCWDGAVAEGDFVAAVSRHRVEEVLLGSSLELPRGVEDRLTTVRRGRLLYMLGLLREAGRAHDLLSEAGIRCLVFKGPVLARLTTGDATLRGFGDVDVIVPAAELARAHGLLVDAGWEVKDGYPVPGPAWAWRHLTRYGYELPLAGRLADVDLHWRLDPLPGQLPDFEALWRDRTRVDLGGHAVWTLSPAHTLAHACSHALKDEWRWCRSLVDVHRLLRLHGPPAAPRHADLATFAVVAHLFGLPVPAPLPSAGVSRRAVATALRTQDRPVPVPADVRFPGAGIAQDLRRRARARPRPAELLPAVATSLMPPTATGPVTDTSAATAIPRALALRAGQFAPKVVAWLRRGPSPAPPRSPRPPRANGDRPPPR